VHWCSWSGWSWVIAIEYVTLTGLQDSAPTNGNADVNLAQAQAIRIATAARLGVNLPVSAQTREQMQYIAAKMKVVDVPFSTVESSPVVNFWPVKP
jgi:hypothetical protein